MSEAECTCYHMGHGAMYCVTVYEDNTKSKVKKRFLIDAGSNQDYPVGSDSLSKQNIEHIKKEIQNSSNNEWIFCLTHLHADHYTAFQTISKEVTNINEKVEKFRIGSLTAGEWEDLTDKVLKSYDDYTVGKLALQEMLKKFKGKVKFLKPVTQAKLLWNDGDVSLYLLFNCMFNLDKPEDAKQLLNANGASFLVKHNGYQTAFWFTGDITGETFNNILRHDKTYCSMQAILNDCVEVVMTPPHHGSIHTLNGIGEVRQDDKNPDIDYYSNQWRIFCESIDLLNNKLNCKLIWSACLYDRFKHPDGAALSIYSTTCGAGTHDYKWAVYKTFESEDEELFDEYFRITNYNAAYTVDNKWRLQNLSRQIIPTLRFYPDTRIATVSNIQYDFQRSD